MREKRRKRWAIPCLLAGPLRVCQRAKAPYSGHATKWSVPTAEHRHSLEHHRGRREESFLSLNGKCPPEHECLHFFFFFSFLFFNCSPLFYVFYELLFELPPWLLVQHLWKTVFKRPFAQALSSSGATNRSTVHGYYQN